MNVGELKEISIVGRSVLPIPDIELKTRNITYPVTNTEGEVFYVNGSTFGIASSMHRNNFNREICYNLSKSGHIIYNYIVFNLGYNTNIIELKHSIVSSETGLSLRSIPNAIEELIKTKVIYKTNRASIYVVNPKCITNCNTEAFEREYNTTKATCIISIGSDNELIYKERIL